MVDAIKRGDLCICTNLVNNLTKIEYPTPIQLHTWFEHRFEDGNFIASKLPPLLLIEHKIRKCLISINKPLDCKIPDI